MLSLVAGMSIDQAVGRFLAACRPDGTQEKTV
jgi:hypothetical protein